MRIHFHTHLGYYELMNEKLKNHFLKIGPRTFVIATVILLLVLDILNGIYLKLALSKRNLSEMMIVSAYQRMDLSTAELDAESIAQMTWILEKSVDFFLFLILINNLFFYFFYLRKKLWAQGYVLFYTLSAAILSVAMLFDVYGMGTSWMIFNIATIPIYLYLYMGIKLLKNETTLVPKKKGR